MYTMPVSDDIIVNHFLYSLNLVSTVVIALDTILYLLNIMVQMAIASSLYSYRPTTFIGNIPTFQVVCTLLSSNN